MKKFFTQNSILPGVLAILLSEIGAAVVLWGGLQIFGESDREHIRWFVVVFLPAFLVMRYYMKQREYLTTTKAAIVTLFVTFIAFMAILLKNNLIG